MIGIISFTKENIPDRLQGKERTMLFNLGTWISRIYDGGLLPDPEVSETAYLLRADGISFLLLSNSTDKLVRTSP